MGAPRAARSYCNAANILVAQVNKTIREMPSKADLAADARALVRRALKASLATLAAGSGYPYASLITVATDGVRRSDLSHLGARPAHQEPRPRPARLDPVRRDRRRRRSAARRAGDAVSAAPRRPTTRRSSGASWRGTRRPSSMPAFRISPSGGWRSRAPIISAASAASSILTPDDLLSAPRRGRAARGRAGHHRAHE